jgi:hypothetical protein
MSMAALLARLQGRRQERRAEKAAEAEVAEALLEGHQARRRQLIADRLTIDRELDRLRDAVAEYERAVTAAENSVGGAELVALNARVAELRADVRRYDEALRASGSALSTLASVLDRLDRAATWSTVDLFTGGTADLWEHARLVEARHAAWAAQRSLDLFAREAARAGMTVPPPDPGNVPTGWFADMFLDGLVVDLVKHWRIDRARERVAAARRWVQFGTTRIEHDRRAAVRELDRLTAERDHLLDVA